MGFDKAARIFLSMIIDCSELILADPVSSKIAKMTTAFIEQVEANKHQDQVQGSVFGSCNSFELGVSPETLVLMALFTILGRLSVTSEDHNVVDDLGSMMFPARRGWVEVEDVQTVS